MAVESTRQVEAVSDAGLIAPRGRADEAAITERITLALIEAVANDQLTAGARVVVVYSGFEAETLDSMTVVRLGEHLERLSSRDLRAWRPRSRSRRSRRSSTSPSRSAARGARGRPSAP